MQVIHPGEPHPPRHVLEVPAVSTSGHSEEDLDHLSLNEYEDPESTPGAQTNKLIELSPPIKFRARRERKTLASMSMPDLNQILKPHASKKNFSLNLISTFAAPPLPVSRRTPPPTPSSDISSVCAQDFPVPPTLPSTKVLEARFTEARACTTIQESGPMLRPSRANLCASLHCVGLEHVQVAPCCQRGCSTGQPGTTIYTTSPLHFPPADFFYPPWNHIVEPALVDPIITPSYHSPTTSTSSTSSPSTLWDPLGSQLGNHPLRTSLKKELSPSNYVQFPTKNPYLYYRSSSGENAMDTAHSIHKKMDFDGMNSFMDMSPEPRGKNAVNMVHKIFAKFARRVKGGRISLGAEES